MIVVSDTSPFNYLVLVDAIDVLPKLFGEVYAPLAVVRELQHPRTPALVKNWIQAPPGWLRIGEPSVAAPNSVGLDPGESQAIALAIELRADAVLIDEKRGREIAKQHGFAVLGTRARRRAGIIGFKNDVRFSGENHVSHHTRPAGCSFGARCSTQGAAFVIWAANHINRTTEPYRAGNSNRERNGASAFPPGWP